MKHNTIKTKILGALVTACAVVTSLEAADPVAAAPETTARPCWYKTPSLSIMTGFIYEPLKPYTIQQWMENLGSRFDADQWVKDFKEVGASHVVFYDKWIDGLVFHDTKTTGFKTKRDFLKEMAAACQRGGLPLVIYFNALSDGNPEFDQWALVDKQGKPVVFNAGWPTRYQTLHSPFRQKCLEQVRELMTNYGPIDGIWHDIFYEKFNTTSEWTACAYEKMFNEPFEKATKLDEFQARTLSDYLVEADAIRRETKQERCVFTANRSGPRFLGNEYGGHYRELVGAKLQYLFVESHSFRNCETDGRMAWALPKHLDLNLNLNKSWFTPLEDAPPPAAYSDEQAIAATAIGICQGAGVNLVLTPGHDGRFGEDLQRAKTVAAWYRKVQPWVADAKPAADVAIVHGPNANAATEFLAGAGVLTRLISPDQPLPSCRAVVVPANTRMDEPLAARLTEYVQKGGTLVTCGQPGVLADLCGVRVRTDAAALLKKFQGAVVKVDSTLKAEFGWRNLIDGNPETVWVSQNTPMPHWLEMTLPETALVSAVELTCRSGGFQVADLDVELPQTNGWQTVKSVRDAKQRIILVAFDAPEKASRLRVKILSERYQGKDRDYADVASIRVLDGSGRDLAAKPKPIQLTGAGYEGAALMAPTAAVEPVSAEVLARFEPVGNLPAVLRRSVGQGKVFTVTASWSAEPGADAAFGAVFCKEVLGERTLMVSDETSRRFRFILTQAAGAHVLHVIDAAVPASDYKPVPVEISLAADRVGHPKRITLADDDKAVAVSEENGRIKFTVQPNPVATVVLKGAN
jgi:hypothetical protein